MFDTCFQLLITKKILLFVGPTDWLVQLLLLISFFFFSFFFPSTPNTQTHQTQSFLFLFHFFFLQPPIPKLTESKLLSSTVHPKKERVEKNEMNHCPNRWPKSFFRSLSIWVLFPNNTTKPNPSLIWDHPLDTQLKKSLGSETTRLKRKTQMGNVKTLYVWSVSCVYGFEKLVPTCFFFFDKVTHVFLWRRKERKRMKKKKKNGR